MIQRYLLAQGLVDYVKSMIYYALEFCEANDVREDEVMTIQLKKLLNLAIKGVNNGR